MLLGMTALTWLLVIPLVLAWPIAGFVIYLVYRSSKRHDEREALERDQAVPASEPS